MSSITSRLVSRQIDIAATGIIVENTINRPIYRIAITGRQQGMVGFNEREKGFETKFKRDQELDFKIMARRNKLLGLWAAEKLGISGADAEAYAKEVVMSDFEKPGEEDVVEKVMGDFTDKEAGVEESELRAQMARLMGTAREQVESEA